jgi:hypothetical protein
MMSISVLAPTSDAFILGFNRVGDPLTLAGATAQWTSFTCPGQTMHIERGGQVEGATQKLDTGVLTYTMRDAGDPRTSPAVLPGRPVKVTVDTGSRIEYAWDLSDLPAGGDTRVSVQTNDVFTATPTDDGLRIQGTVATQAARIIFRPTAWDSSRGPQTVNFYIYVRNLRSSTAWFRLPNQANYYTLSPLEPWTLRGTATPVLLDNSPLEVTLPFTGTFDIEIRYVLALTTDPSVVFTGTMQTPSMKPTDDGHYTLEFTAVDANQTLAQTKRYGAVSVGGAGYQTAGQRIEQLMTSAPVPTRLDDSLAGNTRSLLGGEWDIWGSAVAGLTRTLKAAGKPAIEPWPGAYGPFVQTATTSAVTYTPGTWGIQRIITGLTPGRRYVVLLPILSNYSPATNPSPTMPWGQSWKARIGMAPWSEAAFSPNLDLPASLTLEFTATGPTAVLQITSADGVQASTTAETYFVLNPTIQEAEPLMLQDVVYESSLANHLQMACDSAGVIYYVDRHGRATFTAHRDDWVTWHFSDVHSDNFFDPFHVCYTNVEIAYDDYAQVNSVQFSQHGRSFDSESNSWVADDYSTTRDNVTSIATYGEKSASIDTSLYTGGSYANAIDRRAAEIFAERARPLYSVRSISFDSLNNGLATGSIEINQAVKVTHEGTTFTGHITGISRNAAVKTKGPQRHTITLTIWSTQDAL